MLLTNVMSIFCTSEQLENCNDLSIKIDKLDNHNATASEWKCSSQGQNCL